METAPFSVRHTLLTAASSSTDVDIALVQIGNWLTGYMKKNVDMSKSGDPSYANDIANSFLNWVNENVSEIAHQNVVFCKTNLPHLISKQFSPDWLYKAEKKRKVAEITQLHFEREAKLRKIDTTPPMEFFTDTNLFIHICQFASLRDLRHLRNTSRCIFQILEQHHSQILANIKTVIFFDFRNLYVVQGNQICKVRQKPFDIRLKEVGLYDMTNRKEFLDKTISSACFEATNDEAEKGFIAKLAPLYDSLAKYFKTTGYMSEN